MSSANPHHSHPRRIPARTTKFAAIHGLSLLAALSAAGCGLDGPRENERRAAAPIAQALSTSAAAHPETPEEHSHSLALQMDSVKTSLQDNGLSDSDRAALLATLHKHHDEFMNGQPAEHPGPPKPIGPPPSPGQYERYRARAKNVPIDTAEGQQQLMAIKKEELAQ